MIPQTHKYDCSLSWLSTDASINICWVKLVLWDQTSPLSEMKWTCMCFPHVSIMPILTHNWANSINYVLYFIYVTRCVEICLNDNKLLLLLISCIFPPSFSEVKYVSDSDSGDDTEEEVRK